MLQKLRGFTLSIRTTECSEIVKKKKRKEKTGKTWGSSHALQARQTSFLHRENECRAEKMAMRCHSKQCVVVSWNLRQRAESLQSRIPWRLLGKDSLLWHITIWCISLSDATKPRSSRCKGCRGRNGKAWDNSSMGLEKSQEQKGVHSGSAKRQNESTLQKYGGRVVLRRDIAKDDSGAYAVFTEQGWFICVTDDCCKNHGCFCKITRLWSTSSWCSVCLRLPRHTWPRSWVKSEDPVVPLERNVYGHPLAGLLWSGQFEEVLLETWMGKSTKLEMSVCSSKTRPISVSFCGWH